MLLAEKRVLVVEDCPDQQRLLLHFLQKAGAEVFLECSGFAALDTIRRQRQSSKMFHAVVMDLILDEADGITATQAIRQCEPLLPVITVTACGSRSIERRWRKAGCCAFLEKPVSPQALIDTIHSATREAARDWLFQVHVQQLVDQKEAARCS